jgi:hypothetical protein
MITYAFDLIAASVQTEPAPAWMRLTCGGQMRGPDSVSARAGDVLDIAIWFAASQASVERKMSALDSREIGQCAPRARNHSRVAPIASG